MTSLSKIEMRGLASEYARGSRIAPHAHTAHQIVHAGAGVMLRVEYRLCAPVHAAKFKRRRLKVRIKARRIGYSGVKDNRAAGTAASWMPWKSGFRKRADSERLIGTLEPWSKSPPRKRATGGSCTRSRVKLGC